jgi:hypothetical protein
MLPTPQEFINSTSVEGNGKKRGSTLLRVDGALENWQLQKDGAPRAQLQALYLIIKECDRYLKKHSLFGGSNGQMKLGGHRSGPSLRSQKVAALRAAALSELRRVAPTIRRALGYVELQKQRHQEKLRGGQGTLTKSLGGGWHYEREQWVQGRKQSMPNSGTMVYQALNAAPFVSDQFMDDHPDIFAKRLVSELSMDEFQILSQVGGNTKVSYYNKISRLQFLALPDGKGGYTDIDERPIDMKEYNKGTADLHMYALDHHGNLFTREAPKSQGEEFFNHSSFNAGREVICAGMVWIREGKLTHIDNYSGHYAPTRDNLLEALRFLNEEGIDLSETRVWWFIDRFKSSPSYQALPLLQDILVPYSEAQELRNGLVRKVWSQGSVYEHNENLGTEFVKERRGGGLRMGRRGTE